MIRPIRRFCPVFVALVALAALLPPTPAAAGRDWSAFPALLTVSFEGPVVRATSGLDAEGRSFVVAFDPARNAWGAPEPVGEPAPPPPRLDQVLVFNGGLFDQFSPDSTIDLGEGFVLARRDTGFALLEDGADRGWPPVTEADIEGWSRELRLGLPRDQPDERLWTLFARGRLRNVPGPFVRTPTTLWFGLAGGFAGGEGQIGGLVAYDRATRSFRVVRHKFIVDAAVTRLLALGDELWIGTGRFAPGRLEGLRGMLLFRPGRNEWRQFAPQNSRISGDLVYDAAAAGDHLWVTTDQGVSRYDRKRRLWSSWYWHPAPGPAGYALRTDLPDDPSDALLE